MRSGMFGRIRSGLIPRVLDEPNLVEQWLAVDAKTVTDGDRVASWVGRINRIEAAQANVSQQPRYYGGDVPSLLLAGSLLNTAAFVPPGKLTVYAKVMFTTAPGSSSNSTVICQDPGGNARSWHCGVSSTKRARFVNFNAAGLTGQAVELDGAVPLSQWEILQGVRDAAPSGINGGTLITGLDTAFTDPLDITNTTYQTNAIAMSIGGRGAGIEYMNGYISEIRLYQGAHSAAMRERVRAEMGM